MQSARWHEDFGQAAIQAAVRNAVEGNVFFDWTCRDGWSYETNRCVFSGPRNFLRLERAVQRDGSRNLEVQDMYGRPVCSLL